MAAWIKMPLGMEVGFGPGNFVLDGDPAPLPKKGAVHPNFRPSLWQNGWMDQDGTWRGSRPQPRRLCIRWGPSHPLQKGGGAPSPIFGPFLLWPNGWMHQDAIGMEVGLNPRDFVFHRDPVPSPKMGWNPSPIFGPCLLRPNGCMDQDATWYRGMPRPRRHCVRWGPSCPSPKGGQSSLPNFRFMSIVAKQLDASRCHSVWR